MNQSNSQNEARNKAGTRYRAYVFAIVTTTVVLLALLLWPLSVDQFQASTEVRLSIDPTMLDGNSANQMIAQAVVRNTKDERLSQLLSEVRGKVATTSKFLNESQSNQIRDAIKVGTRSDKKSNGIELQLSFVGSGTQDEIEFVNRLANAVAADVSLARSTAHVDQALSQWKSNLVGQLQQQGQALMDANQLLKGQLVTAINNGTPSVNEQIVPGNQGPNDEISSITLQQQISQLYIEIEKQKSDNFWDDTHPTIVQMNQQVRQLREQLNQSYQSGSSTRIKNPFMNASMSNQLDAATNSASIGELETSLQILEQINREVVLNAQTQIDSVEKFHNELSSLTSRSELIRLDKIMLASSADPIGGAPNSQQLLFIFLMAIGLGSVFAWQIDPMSRTQRIRSAEHAESVLGVPTIGVLTSTESLNQHNESKQRWFSMLFKGFEYILLFLVVALVIATLVNSEIFAALMSNPFQAISKVIWMLTPR